MRRLRRLIHWLCLAACACLTVSAHAQVYLSEILFNPPGAADTPNEYIELRGPPNFVLANGTYLVAVEGDANGNPGTVQNVFNLSGRAIGGNGFLVLLQKATPYNPNSNATTLVHAGNGSGWGDDKSSPVGHDGEGGQTDLENAAVTFFLIQTARPPDAGDDDIDPDNDGIPIGPVYASWTILDSVGVLDSDGSGDIAYGAINFRRNSLSAAAGNVVPIGFTPSYVGRAGNTTGSTAADWVASGNLNGTAPNWTLGTAANTTPVAFANSALTNIGGPNFNAPPLDGVVVIETGGSTDVGEGSGTDTYTLALNTTPVGTVSIEITSSGQTQISTDGGASFGTLRTLAFSNTTRQSLMVRALDDSVVDTSPHINRVTHRVTSTGDPARYPLSALIPGVNVRVAENDFVVLSELKTNPPGPDDTPFEFVEIRGVPGALLRNVYLVAVEGDAGNNPGNANMIVNLDGLSIGSSGLLIVSAVGNPYSIPAGTTPVFDAQLNTPGGALGNGTMSFLLVTSPTNIAEGTDLDGNDNGVLGKLPDGSAMFIMDAVGWSDGGTNDHIYGSVTLTQPNGTPDAASRFPFDDTPLSAAAWYNGDLAGTNADSIVFDSGTVSTNFPLGRTLTPGYVVNFSPTIDALMPLSGVIGDPTNPDLNFIVSDDESPAESLLVTAASSNPAVAPNGNLTVIVGADGQRALRINPVGVGYATITITVSDDDKIGQAAFLYAASAMGRPNGRFHTGASDGSTAFAIDANLMFVGDDENQKLRLFDRHGSGGPIAQFDMSPFLGLTDFYSDGRPREVDIEASTRVGNRIYWMSAHSHSGTNETHAVETRTNRSRVFATDLAGTGASSTLSYVGRYDFLKLDLVNWDQNNIHGRGADYFGLAASTAAGVDPKALDGSGFNIEGLCMAPGSATTAYVAFRAPVVSSTNRAYALIVPVLNFTTLAVGTGPPGSAQFGAPIELNLGCRGIRSIEGNASGGYLIVAGPPGPLPEAPSPPNDFRLFTWSGQPGDPPQERAADLSGLNVEGIVELPPGLWTATNQFQLISDSGTTVYYGDGVQAKHLPVTNFKKSRTDWVALGEIVVPTPVIRSITVGGGNTLITWKAVAGRSYQVQFKYDLSDAAWQNANGVVLATSAIATATLPNGAALRCFFQVRALE